MINSSKKMAGAAAVGAKTARACDYCIRKRARWYCAADDAFLCQLCDGSVHSANPLARRHERVRLKTASDSSCIIPSSSSSDNNDSSSDIIPSWHRGLKKKPRTPRHGKQQQQHNHVLDKVVLWKQNNRPPIVPELGAEDNNSHEEEDNIEEDQLLYRVPTFDPFMVGLLSSPTTTITSSDLTKYNNNYTSEEAIGRRDQAESKSIQSIILLGDDVHGVDSSSPGDELLLLPSDLELAEFAADVETLLGKGLEEESFGIEELGLLDCYDEKKDSGSGSTAGTVVKTEEEETIPMQTVCHLDTEEIDMLREPFELTFDYGEDYTPGTTFSTEEEDANVIGNKRAITRQENGLAVMDEGNKEWKKQKISLKLDYDAISTAWASQGTSPWMNGEKPQINPDDCWLHSLTSPCGSEPRPLHGEMAAMGTGGGHTHREDGGREARVSRYREKRRTRLFSKKIRYEVRKLNAEKRPRMKGRFVKQSSFASHPIPMFTK